MRVHGYCVVGVLTDNLCWWMSDRFQSVSGYEIPDGQGTLRSDLLILGAQWAINEVDCVKNSSLVFL